MKVSRLYFSTRPQCAREKFGVWGRDYYGVDFNYRAVRWRGFVPPSVCVVAGCHSLPLPATQEICPHPLTEDAEVGRGKVLSRDCGIAIDPRAPGLPSTSLQDDNKGLKGWSLICPL